MAALESECMLALTRQEIVKKKKIANECFSHRIEIDAVNMMSDPSETEKENGEPRTITTKTDECSEKEKCATTPHSLLAALTRTKNRCEWRKVIVLNLAAGISLWSSIKINYNRAIFPLKVANEPLINALYVPFHCKMVLYSTQQRLE